MAGVDVKQLLPLRLLGSRPPSLVQPAACPPSGLLVGSHHAVRRALGQALPRDGPADVVDGTIVLLLLRGQGCSLRGQAIQNPRHIGCERWGHVGRAITSFVTC